MKKKVAITSIIGLLLMLGGFALFLFMGNMFQDFKSFYGSDYIFQNFGTALASMFNPLSVMSYVNIGLCAVILILLIVQIVMAIRKKHGPAAWVSVGALLGIALIYFFVNLTFFLPLPHADYPFGYYQVFIAYIAQQQQWLVLIFFIPALLFLVGFILFLVGLISELRLLAELPYPTKDVRNSDEVMVIHDEDLSSEDSARAAEAALASGGYPERHAADMVPPPAAPGIQGPLLVQYINTYAPASNGEPVSTAPGAKKNAVPVSEIQGAITGEKPLTAEDIRKIVQEEMGTKKDQPVIVNVPSTPKPEEKGLTADDVRQIFSEELGRYLSTGEDGEIPEESEILVEEEPAPSLTADDIRSIIAAELAKKAPEEEKPEEPLDVRAVIRDELEAHRRELDEEAKRKAAEEEAAKAREEELQKAREEAAAAARKEAEEAAKSPSLTAEDIRSIIAAELAKKAPEEPKKEQEMTLDLIREVIRAELKDVAPVKEEKVPPVTVVLKESDIVRPEPKPEPKEEPKEEPQLPVVNIIVKSAEPKPEPEPEPEVIEEEEPTTRVVGQVNPNLPPHDKIIRIPFPTRMVEADKEMKSNYNELKAEIMSYGVKSRVSNSGDTFRLHKVTFVKLTVAGKGLKLYFALNPKDYQNSTLPVQDAGHKGVYRDIPLVFKVKSELSVRRAKQLIADVMEKNGLEQGKIEPHNWADELKDYKPTGSDKDDD